jgi:hypothetical protein
MPGQPATTGSPVAATATPTKFRAPPNWKPEIAEKFSTLPEDVQAEVDRVNREFKVGMQKNAEAAKSWEGFQQVLSPYQAMLGGQDPIKTTQGLFQMAYNLQHGAPQQKAQLVAHLVKQFGVDIGALDSALSGQPAPQGQQQAMDPAQIIAQAKAEFQREAQQREAQAKRAQIDRDVAKFAEEAEFFERVRGRMSGLSTGYSAQGVDKDLKSLYDEACWADPEIRAVLLQRERAQQATAGQASTMRAKAASAAVKSQPAPPVPGKQADNTADILREEMAKARRGT